MPHGEYFLKDSEQEKEDAIVGKNLSCGKDHEC